MRVILVHMPWGALERPALGLSLLAANLRRRGIGCEVRYLNMRFADRVGVDLYQRITHDLPHVAFAGDWLFTESLYGPDSRRDALYVAEVLRGQWRLDAHAIDCIVGARAAIEPFLAEAIDALAWPDDGLVGFTSTFEQNIASLALAQRLKQRHPGLSIAFGGANWEAAMGRELHRSFPFVDYACSGEADATLPLLVEALELPLARRVQRLRRIPGLVFRVHGATKHTGPATPIEDMDDLPTPAFEDYFEARERSQATSQVPPTLLFEGSRGCWWGAKSHCTFCGLNGHSMGYRSKSPARLIDEITTLVRRWPCPTIEAVDNILDMGYFDTVLPALERLHLPGPVFFEVKANLKRHHVAALQRASILRIQPGVESLSDHVLQLMRKGTTTLRNVQLLKWCREYGISVDWNLLYAFPGETDADYRGIAALLPKIRHLQMPGACGPIRLDRFSPYFERPDQFGIAAVQPMPVYRFLYPVAGLRLHDVAYYFECGYAPGHEPSMAAHDAVAIAEALRRDAGAGSGTLQAIPHRDGGLNLCDTRRGARVAALRLSAYERRIVECIDEVASPAQVVRNLQAAHPGCSFDEANVRGFLDELVANDMAASDGARYVGLALMPAGMRPALEQASRRGASFQSRRTIPIAARPAEDLARV